MKNLLIPDVVFWKYLKSQDWWNYWNVCMY